MAKANSLVVPRATGKPFLSSRAHTFDGQLLESLTGRAQSEEEYFTALRKQHWNSFAGEESPHILDADGICIATDGGMSDVDELLYIMKYFTATIVVTFVVANVYMISQADLTGLFFQQADAEKEAAQKFLIGKWLLRTVFPHSNESFFHGDMDKIIPALEFSFLVYVICRLVGYAIVAFAAPHLPRWFPGTGEYWRWHMVSEIFWCQIPQLSSFSAMRLLYYVAPTVVGTEAYVVVYFVNERVKKSTSIGQKLIAFYPLIKYAASVIFALVVGFDAFLVKCRLAYQYIDDDEFRWGNVLGVVVFLIQLLGVVNLNWFVRARLIIFIFGNEFGNLDTNGKARADVWSALLARRVYQEFGVFKGTIVMLGFDDYDFQMLVLDDDKKAEKMRRKTHGTPV